MDGEVVVCIPRDRSGKTLINTRSLYVRDGVNRFVL